MFSPDQAEAIIAILLAIVVEALFSFSPWLRMVLDLPRNGIQRLTVWFDRKLNREKRGRLTLRLRGAVIAVVVLSVAAAAGYGIDAAVQRHIAPVSAIVLVFMLAMGRPIAALRKVRSALRAGDDRRASVLAAALVRYDVVRTDRYAIGRAAVEGAPRVFADGVLASLFWFLMLGLPAVFVYRSIGWAADVIGRHSPKHADIGFTVSRLDDVLSLPGALLAGPLLSLAALFCPGGNVVRGLAGWCGDFFRRGPVAGYRVEGVMAGILGLSLGGPRVMDGETLPGPWIGQGRARVEIADIERATIVLFAAGLVIALALAFALVAGAR